MQRITLAPRDNWQQKVESVGLTFHTLENGQPYWDESAAYSFTAAEIDTLEAAGYKLQEMCLAAAQHIIDQKRYAELDIPAFAVEAIEWAWNNEPPALYGRFDLSWAGAQSGHAPKLLEYNADTPTSLLEAAVVQWHWLKDVSLALAAVSHLGKTDQFNSIHEKLIAKWKDIDPYLSKPIYFAALDNPEDQLTVTYLRDTAQQAGLETLQMFMNEIGWNDEQQLFLDPDEQPMFSIFKLYPWEAMIQEEFGPHAIDTYPSTRWIEPIWKMLLSNKGILPILWQLYPNHELLLESHFAESPSEAARNAAHLRNYVRKPLMSREGANITLVREGSTITTTPGPYNGKQIIQALAPDAVFDHRHTVLGLWMIDQDCCGLGVRESFNPITDNLSSFVPHFFV
ncbi:glutathionylspermidine synthase family protein [Tunturiibacter empetritectus]|uniref:Glutathionylspermidine synthase n=1 Tax=Tunturiibacter lichenicola TaxID=2051959 RepID=A0A852VMK1_9BACT|nr:glutathionylspermidine synthase family protein [Edaphobacter lichenicola]NYF91305.1 glutathionylspermidine synthase [Edaphobacter lichenicola]